MVLYIWMDVLRVVSGCVVRHWHWKSLPDCYEVSSDPSERVHGCIVKLVYRVCIFGWMYYCVCLYRAGRRRNFRCRPSLLPWDWRSTQRWTNKIYTSANCFSNITSRCLPLLLRNSLEAHLRTLLLYLPAASCVNFSQSAILHMSNNSFLLILCHSASFAFWDWWDPVSLPPWAGPPSAPIVREDGSAQMDYARTSFNAYMT